MDNELDTRALAEGAIKEAQWISAHKSLRLVYNTALCGR